MTDSILTIHHSDFLSGSSYEYNVNLDYFIIHKTIPEWKRLMKLIIKSDQSNAGWLLPDFLAEYEELWKTNAQKLRRVQRFREIAEQVGVINECTYSM